MARIKANVCDCDGKMKRLYTRAEGGAGWTPVGWRCDCGCICMDEGEWRIIDCSTECATDCCEPTSEEATVTSAADGKAASDQTMSCC